MKIPMRTNLWRTSALQAVWNQPVLPHNLDSVPQLNFNCFVPDGGHRIVPPTFFEPFSCSMYIRIQITFFASRSRAIWTTKQYEFEAGKYFHNQFLSYGIVPCLVLKPEFCLHWILLLFRFLFASCWLQWFSIRSRRATEKNEIY